MIIHSCDIIYLYICVCVYICMCTCLCVCFSITLYFLRQVIKLNLEIVDWLDGLASKPKGPLSPPPQPWAYRLTPPCQPNIWIMDLTEFRKAAQQELYKLDQIIIFVKFTFYKYPQYASGYSMQEEVDTKELSIDESRNKCLDLERQTDKYLDQLLRCVCNTTIMKLIRTN